jgi:hypothetical protein
MTPTPLTIIGGLPDVLDAMHRLADGDLAAR